LTTEARQHDPPLHALDDYSLSPQKNKGCENKLCRMNPHQTSLGSVRKCQDSSQERITTTKVPTSYSPRNII
jgi:hypothetical protein